MLSEYTSLFHAHSYSDVYAVKCRCEVSDKWGKSAGVIYS